MPGYIRFYGGKIGDREFNPVEGLEYLGPLIQVQIRPPGVLVGAISKDSPQTQTEILVHHGKALIDTGASMCMVKQPVADRLGLTPHGKTEISSATEKDATRNVYVVGIAIGDMRTQRDPIQAVELMDFNQPFDFIIGRNVLKNMIFTYTGFGGVVTLAE